MILQNPWFLLTVAIVMEVVGTACLTASNGMTVKSMAIASLMSYAITFYCMSVPLKYLPAGVVYAIWSGVGIVFISLIGLFVFHQHLDKAAMIGIILILAGVLTIKLFSSSTAA